MKKTLTKAEEVALLQRLTVTAREDGAEYLHEALIALAVPFESAIRSDFPGEMAVHDLLDASRAERDTLANLRREVATAREDLRRAIEEAKDAKRETARAQNELSECRAIARRLATA
jgi:vacuolar-type H+-ATPase subunit I/STV1